MAISLRKYVAIDAIGIATLNAVINGGYTWWLRRSPDLLSLYGENGIALDLAATPVWIAVLTTLLGTAAVRRKVWEGRIEGPRFTMPAILHRLPFAAVPRAAIFGAAAAVSLALPLWLALWAWVLRRCRSAPWSPSRSRSPLR